MNTDVELMMTSSIDVTAVNTPFGSMSVSAARSDREI